MPVQLFLLHIVFYTHIPKYKATGIVQRRINPTSKRHPQQRRAPFCAAGLSRVSACSIFDHVSCIKTLYVLRLFDSKALGLTSTPGP